MALDFPVGEITPVAQDKIASLQLQCRGGGKVVVAGCAVNGLLTERRQQRGDENFAGLPEGEARFAGAEIDKILTQAGGAKK